MTIPDDSVHVHPGSGTATYEVQRAPMKDYHDGANAFVGGGPKPVPGYVSFKVEWTASGLPVSVNNPAQKYRSVFRNATAQMEWSARSVDYEFQSGPLSESDSGTGNAQIGVESNGSFY